jgi:norsolorinic acid ketoreductase
VKREGQDPSRPSRLTRLTGLGKTFVRQYLERPNHLVIGTLRDLDGAAADELRQLPKATNSTLILLKLEYSSSTSAATMVNDLKRDGIDRVDIVIANAGIGGQQGTMASIDPAKLADVYLVNTVGPAMLFIAVKPLLDRSSAPKWLSMSSGLASTTNMEMFGAFPGFPYNSSKTALNHITKAIHVEHPNIVSFAVSPGYGF